MPHPTAPPARDGTVDEFEDLRSYVLGSGQSAMSEYNGTKASASHALPRTSAALRKSEGARGEYKREGSYSQKKKPPLKSSFFNSVQVEWP